MAKIIIKFPYMLKPGPRMEKANAIQKSLEKDDIVVLDSSVEVTVIRDGDDILIDPRSKGDWIVTSEDNDGVHRICCPFCSYEKGSNNIDPIIVTFTNFPKFCENCGADMRGDN